MIEITVKELQARFVEYNHTYFNDELRMPLIKTHSGVPYGEFKNKPRKTITISKDVHWEDDSLKNVLVHEMIHCLNSQRKHYEGFHGKYFKAEQKIIYKRFGYKVKTHYSYLFEKEKPPKSTLLRIGWYIKRHFKGVGR